MKLAIAGKGGSGKTSIAGTMARRLAREGNRVLAIDGDSNPNLALTLGIDPQGVEAPPTLTREMVERGPGGAARLTVALEELCDTHSLTAPDGVRLIIMAHPHHAGTG
jgi:CO dehydrogenase maturation factor